MKRDFYAMLLLLLLASVSLGQANKPTQSAQAQKILQLEQKWMDAMKARDEATLNQLVGAEFALAGISDLDRLPVPRATWMDNTLHHLKVESVSFDKTKIHIFGDTAIVQAVFTWKGAFDDEHFIDTTLLIDTWLRRGGSWQVVSRLVSDYKKPDK